MHPSARRANRDGALGTERVLMIPLQFPAGRDLGRLAAHTVVMNRPGFPLEVTLVVTLTSACCDDLITPVLHRWRASRLYGRVLRPCTAESERVGMCYIR